MKKHCLILLSLICLFVLTSCGIQNFIYSPPQPRENLNREVWMSQINLNPANWLYHADRWFLTGMPNCIEQSLCRAPMYRAISKTHLRITNFQNIVSKGSYQIQIVRGNCDRIFILGPNEQARQISVTIFNKTLFITQAGNCKMPLNKVIIRISIRCLRNLMNNGSGSIYGRDILSDHLVIRNGGSGQTMLVGRMNLCQINQMGSGKVVIIGAFAPSVNIKIAGSGNVYVSGRVGIQSIYHRGNGCLNIIGADTNALCINTSGCGVTTISGFINLKRVYASSKSQVYLYWVTSPEVSVCTRDKARVGLAGRTINLNVNTTGYSRFYGKNLHSINAYVRSFDNSHANVTADKKAFTFSGGNSSIYFYGPPTILSKYITGRGSIIPAWTNGNCTTCRPTMVMPRFRTACCED